MSTSENATPAPRLDLRSLYRAGLTAEEDRIEWKTVARHLAIVFAVALALRLPYYMDGLRPLNDGGMFALLLDWMRTHHLQWPTHLDYNRLNIPMGYPPLGFYLAALATSLPGQGTLLVMTWEPLLFNLATIAAAYFIAHEVYKDPFLRLLTALVYSVVGWTCMWLIMGGGITRSPGEFFCLLGIAMFLRSCNRQSMKLATVTGVLGGLTLLTHLECILMLVISLPVLAVCFPRPLANLGRMMYAGCVGVVITIPWLLWMWTHIGFGPMINALHSGYGNTNFDFTLPLLLVVAVILAWAARFPFLIWLMAEFIGIRRNPATHSIVIRAIIIAWIATVLVMVFFRFVRSPRWQKVLTAALALAMAIPMPSILDKRTDRLADLVANTRAQLSSDEREAMQAVPLYTRPEARFVVLSERTENWFMDFEAEWFPYYANRHCMNTAQGREWLPNRDFQRATNIETSLIALSPPPNFDTLIYDEQPDYLLVISPLDENHQAVVGIYQRVTVPTPVYKNRSVAVYAFDKEKLRAASARRKTLSQPGAKP